MSDFDLSSFVSVSQTNDEQGLCLHVNNESAQLKVSLFGGHVLSFIPKKDNIDRLWVSSGAIFDNKTPIRGGVPVCWPWFSSYDAFNGEELSQVIDYPSHGFARSQMWQITEISETVENDVIVETTLVLSPTLLGQYGFSELLSVKLEIQVSDSLILTLKTLNSSHKNINITQALHTYFRVNDITNLQIHGIQEDYYDKVTDTYDNQLALPYTVASEVDRVHLFDRKSAQNNQIISLFDAGINQTMTHIEHIGNNSVVVWNPWIERCEQMKDMASDSYKTMMCIEAATTEVVCVKANSEYQLSQIIK